MQVGIHFVDFTLAGWCRVDRAAWSATRSASPTRAVSPGSPSWTTGSRWRGSQTANDPMLEGYTSPRLRRRPDPVDDPRPARHRCDLPAPGPAGQDRRRPSTCSRAAGPSSASAPPGTSVSTSASASRIPPSSERFERLEETLQICLQMWSDDDGPVRGQALPAGRDDLLAAADRSDRSADPHRRQRREEDPAPRGPLRRRVQPLRHRRPTMSPTSSRCSNGTARTRIATRPTIRKTILAMGNPLDDVDGFVAPDGEVRRARCHRVDLMPGKDPVAYTTGVCEHIVPRLADLP